MTWKKRIVGVAMVILAGAVSGYWLMVMGAGDPPPRILVSGNIEIDDVELSFKMPGRVEQRFVDEGMAVEEDEVVAELDRSDLESEVAIRRAEAEAAEAAWQELDRGSRPQEIKAAEAARDMARAAWEDLKAGSRVQEKQVAQAALLKAQVQRDRLRQDYERAKALAEDGTISREEFDRVKSAYEVALKQVEETAYQLSLVEAGFREHRIQQAEAANRKAEAEYALVVEGPRQEQIDQAHARWKQAEAALRLAQTRLGYATLRSPISGIVLSENVEPGEYVSPGTPIVTVGDLENVWLRAYINETDLGRVKVGQKVRLTTDTYPDREYPGRVSFIASEAEFTPKNVQTEEERVKLVYRIKVDVPNPNTELKPGMPADAEILTGSP